MSPPAASHNPFPIFISDGLHGLDNMLHSNLQWASGVYDKDPNFFTRGTKGQKPKVLWIGCSDSRVPETTTLGADPGDVFVHRNIANQFHLKDSSAESVLSYAVDHLEVQHVVVVGHSHCGGAQHCMDASKTQKKPPSTDSYLEGFLEPLTDLARRLDMKGLGKDAALQKLVEENIKAQVDNVIKTDVIKNAWKGNKKSRDVAVHGWVYMLETGIIRDLRISKDRTGNLDIIKNR